MPGFILYGVMPLLPFVCTTEQICLSSGITSVILVVQVLNQEWPEYAKNWIHFGLHETRCGMASSPNLAIHVYKHRTCPFFPKHMHIVSNRSLFLITNPNYFFEKQIFFLKIKLWDCSATGRYRIRVLRQRHSDNVHSKFYNCHFLLLQRNWG